MELESRGKMERKFRMGKERVDGKSIEGSEWTMPIRKRKKWGREGESERKRKRKENFTL